MAKIMVTIPGNDYNRYCALKDALFGCGRRNIDWSLNSVGDRKLAADGHGHYVINTHFVETVRDVCNNQGIAMEVKS